MTDPRRTLPSVSALLEEPDVRELLRAEPRAAVLDAIRGAIDAARHGGSGSARGEWSARVREQLALARRAALHPVLNATGVVLHTNLGRAPLADAAIAAVAAAAGDYTNLEYDIERGERGSRHAHCVQLLRELTGAEDAMLVNNCAAALVLSLAAFARGREAVISRGELIEIGGSFRVPDIMGESGAILTEVGTTNRTHAQDYRAAITPRTGAVVKVHRSNFTVGGFVAEASTAELAAIAAEHGLPLIQDLGSGLLIPLDERGLGGEPTMRDMVTAGATLVLASGDKLLGGPQAGIMVGRAPAVEQLRRHPLARAFRVDKLTIAALQATLQLYRDPGDALRSVPILAMLTMPRDQLRARTERFRDALGTRSIEVVDVDGSVGGGAFPGARLPSCALRLPGDPEPLERSLRLGTPAVIARIADGAVLADLRAIPVNREPELMDALRRVLA